jgi:hypothetical protein
MQKLIIPLLFFVITAFPQTSLVNSSHLDKLYEEVVVNKQSIGIIHIYANAPDYNWVDASGEGIACIDDAARAAVFYMRDYKATSNKKYLSIIKNLINFQIYMHSSNGFFYNFIWKDYSIDSTYKTSVAEPNWWSWRALWALAEAEKFYKDKDAAFAGLIKKHLEVGIKALDKWLSKENQTVNYGGYNLPAWLPFETGADQSAVIIKALSVYYGLHKSDRVKAIIEHLCAGIIKMQQGDEKHIPYGAFLSWQNTWHSWGNSQSDALIDAGRVLNKKEFIYVGVKEIKSFYRWLANKGFYSGFTVDKDNNGNSVFKDTVKFSQIAYGIRPIIFSCMNAYEVLKDTLYLNIAMKGISWFFKENPCKALMYDPETGIGYDGINSYEEVNRNSGAESTIESLLSVSRLESNVNAKKQLFDLYKSTK